MSDKPSSLPPDDAPPLVKIQKRAPKPPAPREKLCATCGRPFHVEDDQKFYDCPRCYRKAHPQRAPRKDATQILVQITCTACGASEYLDYTPPDPSDCLCKACFAKQKREPGRTGRH